MRIAHISDLHILDLTGTSPAAFLNKRITGAVNLLLNRAHSHHLHVVKSALDTISRADVDHIVVTGDISNLSLDAEFSLAASLFRELGDGRRLSVIPGNHDNYTYKSARKGTFERYFQEWMQSDLPEYQTDGQYPYVKCFQDTCIIGLSSSVPTPPIWATGRVSADQLGSLASLLNDERLSDLFKVVLVHHPLEIKRYPQLGYLRRLENAAALKSTLYDGDVPLLLHGHNHRNEMMAIQSRDPANPLWAVEAGSTSYAGSENPAHTGTFNIYDIESGRFSRVSTFRYEKTSDRFEPLEPRSPGS